MRKKLTAIAMMCATVVLLALGSVLPALADDAENTAPIWQNVGRKYTIEDPAGLKWWYGDQAEVSWGENSLTMSMMHCLSDGGFEYSFTEDAQWSLLPSTIRLGDEGSLVVDGSLEISKNQYSEYHYSYYYGGSEQVPMASLTIRMDIGYFYPDRDDDDGNAFGKHVETQGQTVFPGYVQLASLRLEDPQVDSLPGSSVSLLAWEPDSLAFSASVQGGDDLDSWNQQAERIVQGDYSISGTQLMAEGYVLTLTIQDSGAGYTSEYFYTFIPNAQEGDTAAAADSSGSSDAADDESTANARMLSVAMLIFFVVCCALGFGIPALLKRRKAQKSDS